MIMIFGTQAENDDISRCFFHLFKILIFRVVGGREGRVKGQEILQNEKRFCQSHSVSQEPCLI